MEHFNQDNTEGYSSTQLKLANKRYDRWLEANPCPPVDLLCGEGRLDNWWDDLKKAEAEILEGVE